MRKRRKGVAVTATAATGAQTLHGEDIEGVAPESLKLLFRWTHSGGFRELSSKVTELEEEEEKGGGGA